MNRTSAGGKSSGAKNWYASRPIGDTDPATAGSGETANARAAHFEDQVQRLIDAKICHGGPIAEPEDARFILEHTRGVHGFFGASSIERLAVERAITEQTRAFKLIMKRRQT